MFWCFGYHQNNKYNWSFRKEIRHVSFSFIYFVKRNELQHDILSKKLSFVDSHRLRVKLTSYASVAVLMVWATHWEEISESLFVQMFPSNPFGPCVVVCMLNFTFATIHASEQFHDRNWCMTERGRKKKRFFFLSFSPLRGI